jgi:DNA-binding Xre family transcriptional regulator
MSRSVGYRWKLRQVMAAHGLWKTSDLGPLLAERGVTLSTAQVYRLVAKVPERLTLRTLAALCDIFSCTPDDLIEIGTGDDQKRPERTGADLQAIGRPRRARVGPGTQ